MDAGGVEIYISGLPQLGIPRFAMTGTSGMTGIEIDENAGDS
jgi:hypothetical protein